MTDKDCYNKYVCDILLFAFICVSKSIFDYSGEKFVKKPPIKYFCF